MNKTRVLGKLRENRKFLIIMIVLLVSCTPIQPSSPAPKPTIEMTATSYPSIKPDDFQVAYYWEVGSLPEPFFYYYVITIGPGNEGEILFAPGYASDQPPEWREKFSVSGEQLEQIYMQLLEIGALTENWQQSADLPDGGSAEKMEVHVYGQTISIPSYVAGEQNAKDINAVYDYLGNLVPTDTWNKLNALHEEYIAAYEE